VSSACLSLIITYFCFVGRNANDWLIGRLVGVGTLAIMLALKL